MKTRVASRPACAVIAVVAALAFATAAVAAEFSADLAGSVNGQAIVGKLYMRGQSVRQEMRQNAQLVIMITRPEKKVAWVINPTNKTYMELKGNAVPDLSTLADAKVPKEVGTRKLVGKEKVNGYLCDKYALVFKDKKMGTQYQWVSTKLKAPLKMEHVTNNISMKLEFKNIKEGKVAASLFELPTGYKKIELPAVQGMQPQPKAGATK
jgi:hypothetical protein